MISAHCDSCFCSYVNEGLVLGQLQGNRFTITLRCGHVTRLQLPIIPCIYVLKLQLDLSMFAEVLVLRLMISLEHLLLP